MEWQEYVQELNSQHSVLDDILSTGNQDSVLFSAAPLVKASILLLEQMTQRLCSFTLMAFPAKEPILPELIKGKILYNICTGKVGTNYDPYTFTAGQKLKLGNAVVEFVKIVQEDGIDRIKVRLADLDGYSVPVETAPFLQVAESNRLSKWEKFAEEKRRHEFLSKSADSSLSIISTLLDYRTHMENSIFLVMPLRKAEAILEVIQIDGIPLNGILFVGRAKHDGTVERFGAGQFAGTPSVVLAPNLNAVVRAIEAGNKVQSIIIDISNSRNIASWLEDLGRLISFGFPMFSICDIRQLPDLEPMVCKGFRIWQWNRERLTEPLHYQLPDLEAKATSINMETNVAYVKLRNDELDKILELIPICRKSFQECVPEVISAWRKMERLIYRAYRSITPVSEAVAESAEGVFGECRSIFKREKRNISAEGYQALEVIFQLLPCQYVVGYCPDKCTQLSMSLRNACSKKIVLIIDDPSQRSEVESYWHETVTKNQNHFSVLSASEYFQRIWTISPDVIVVGWLRNVMCDLIYGYTASSISVLLYDTETRWQSASLHHWNKLINDKRNSDVISGINPEQKPPPILEQRVISSDSPDLSELSEFEDIFSPYHHAIEGTNPDSETVIAIPVYFSGDLLINCKESMELLVVTDILLNGPGAPPMITLPSNLHAGDYVVLRESGRDIIREIADQILAEEGKDGLRKIAGKWHDSIRMAKAFKKAENLVERVKAVGCARSTLTIRNWVTNDEMIAPNAKQDIEYIAKATEDDVLLEMLEQVYSASREVQAAHLQAGKRLSELLQERISSMLQESADFDLYNMWEPLRVELEGIGAIKILYVLDVGVPQKIHPSAVNRLLEDS